MTRLTRVGCFLLAALLVTSGCSESKKARRLAAGEKHYQAGEFAKAELEFQGARQISPLDPLAIARLGEIYYRQGRYNTASAFLQKALEVNPGNTDVMLLMARTKTEFGRPSEAFQLAQQVYAKSPTNVEALLLMADTANRSQLSTARQAIDNAPPALKNSSSWHTARGMLLGKERQFDAAIKELQTATEANPKDYVAHQALGTLHFLRGELPLAEAALKRAHDEAPPRSNTRMTYIEFIRRTKGDAEAKALAEELAKRAPDFVPTVTFLAELASAQTDKTEAGKLVDRLLTLDPSNYKGLVLKGSLMIANRDTNAVSYFERMADMWRQAGDARKREAAQNSPTNKPSATATNLAARPPQDDATAQVPPLVLQKLGEAYLISGETDRALNYLNQALNADTNLLDAVILRDALWANRGGTDLERAITSLQSVVKRAPALVNARVLLAEAYKSQGRMQLAAEQYTELSRRNPKSADFLVMNAIGQIATTNFSQARKALEQALELSPAHLGAVEQLTHLDLREGKRDAALKRLEDRIQKDPKAAQLHYLSALAHLSGAQPGQTPLPFTTSPQKPAEAALMRALEIDPTNWPAARTLTALYEDTGNSKAALQQLLAFNSRTNNADSLLLLAFAHERAGDQAAAIAAYEKLIQTSPNNPVALNNLAAIYVEKPAQASRAVELATRARDLAASRPDLVMQRPMITDTLAWALYKTGNYEQALTTVDDALRQLTAIIAKAPNQLRPALTNSMVEMQIHQGLSHYMLGNERESQSILATTLKIAPSAPNHAEARAALNVLALDPKNPDPSSVPSLEKRVAAAPEDPVALRRYVAALLQGRQWAKAAEAYQHQARVARANSLRAENMMLAAEIYAERLSQPAQALELAKSARALDERNPKLAKLMGRLLNKAGDPQRASAVLEDAVRADNDPLTRLDLAMAYYAQGQVQEAERQLKTVSQAGQSPVATQAATLLELTAAATAPDKASQASGKATDLLKTEPQNLPALHVVAMAQEHSSTGAEALRGYEKLLAQYPTFTPAAKRLIIAQAKLGNNDAALTLANKYREAVSSDPELQKVVGLLAFKKGDFQTAIRQLQALENPDPVVTASLQVAKHKMRQRVDVSSIERAISAGLPKDLEAQAREAVASVGPGRK